MGVEAVDEQHERPPPARHPLEKLDAGAEDTRRVVVVRARATAIEFDVLTQAPRAGLIADLLRPVPGELLVTEGPRRVAAHGRLARNIASEIKAAAELV